MATSPLELYESAYRLHYIENRIPEAVVYYKKLIKEFPDANECGYAVIQLQKIKAQNVSDNFTETSPSNTTGKQLHPLLLICLLLLFGSLLFSAYLYNSFTSKLIEEKNHLSTTLNALGKIARGEDDEALPLLNQLKQFNPEAIAPYELSADIFRKQQKYNEARNEYTTYFEKNPEKKPAGSESAYMTFDKPQKKIPAVAPQPPEQSPAAPAAEPPSPLVKKRALRKRIKTVKPPPPPNPTPTRSPAKQKNGLFLVDPDSISYF